MKSNIGVGDWVQAAEEIAEENMRGPGIWVHARKGGVGHVLEMHDGEWAFVFWERTGTSTDVHIEDLQRLGGAETGRITG